MHRLLVIASVILCAIPAAPLPRAGAENTDIPAAASTSPQRRFAQFDRNNDQYLSAAEYALSDGSPDVLSRDFRLFDADRDERLSEQEFESIPQDAVGFRRGEIPDPFAGILARAVEAMDESYDGWHFRPEETVDSTTFTINYAASISTDGRRQLDRVLILHADQNQDRDVDREEAIRFLEIQLGMRWITGDLLRQPDGRVVDFAEFIRSDADGDSELSKDEFLDHWWNSATAEEDFERLDVDDDERITLGEFANPSEPTLRDPIEMFRSADTNLNAELDAAELQAATPSSRAYLIASNLSGFDEDGNGELSLSEYRLSMLGNYNCPWENIPKDQDRDQYLSFDEFKFDARNLFQLQRRYYFHRLDRDGDGKLSPSEFEFRKHTLGSLYRISVNGEESSELYQHEDFPVVGSPSVSRDGRWVLFDATPPEGSNRSQILLMTSEGKDVRDLCDGLMPSWSNDGTQFACSRYEGGTGVWIMNLDGTPEKRIDDGWAAQWSPDGESIAYTNDNSIRVYNVRSAETRVVLPKGSHPYLYIYWNMCWSPDSRRLVFKGKLADKQEIATINVTGQLNLKKVFSTSKEMGADLAWSPDGRRILFNMQSPEHRRSLIFQLDLESREPPKLVPEANTSRGWGTVTFSPDGKWMFLSTAN